MNPFTTLPKLIRSKPIADQLEKDVKTMNKTNWKTSLAGAIVCALALAKIWAPADYQQKIQETSLALAGVGLVAAKDHSN